MANNSDVTGKIVLDDAGLALIEKALDHKLTRRQLKNVFKILQWNVGQRGGIYLVRDSGKSSYYTEHFLNELKNAIDELSPKGQAITGTRVAATVASNLQDVNNNALGKALGDTFEVLMFDYLSQALQEQFGDIFSSTLKDQDNLSSVQFQDQYAAVYRDKQYIRLIHDLRAPAKKAASDYAEKILAKNKSGNAALVLYPKAGSNPEGDLIFECKIGDTVIRHVIELKSQFSTRNEITWSTLSDQKNYGGVGPPIGQEFKNYTGSFGSYVRFLMMKGVYNSESDPKKLSDRAFIENAKTEENLRQWMTYISGTNNAKEMFMYFLSKGAQKSQIESQLKNKSLIVGATGNADKTLLILDLDEAVKQFPDPKLADIRSAQDGKSSITSQIWKSGNTRLGAFDFAKTKLPEPNSEVKNAEDVWRYTTFKMTINPRQWAAVQNLGK